MKVNSNITNLAKDSISPFYSLSPIYRLSVFEYQTHLRKRIDQIS